MANAPKPPRKSTKGTPPQEQLKSANLNKSNEDDWSPINFRVPKPLKKDFASTALEEEISMTQLFKKCFELYKNTKYGNP